MIKTHPLLSEALNHCHRASSVTAFSSRAHGRIAPGSPSIQHLQNDVWNCQNGFFDCDPLLPFFLQIFIPFYFAFSTEKSSWIKAEPFIYKTKIKKETGHQISLSPVNIGFIILKPISKRRVDCSVTKWRLDRRPKVWEFTIFSTTSTPGGITSTSPGKTHPTRNEQSLFSAVSAVIDSNMWIASWDGGGGQWQQNYLGIPVTLDTWKNIHIAYYVPWDLQTEVEVPPDRWSQSTWNLQIETALAPNNR